MQMRSPSAAKSLYRKIWPHRNQIRNSVIKPCDVFINHRGIDTKRTISGLLYDDLSRLGLNPFLDSKNLQAGDRLFDKINKAIADCKVGVAVFSPTYCDSYFCLHELAMFMETKKKVIPIFYDVKPSQLHVKDNGSCPVNDLERFKYALEEAKHTVGLTFNTDYGNWSEFLTTATHVILKILTELDGEAISKTRKYIS
ncbi:hypothetical protein K2173_001556 [Erythroxylum novogranatense]|uniref:TIR domain-containing protein n=1 Tax=Erythroxylum novogranatense TaxID=1862640 RepID=A0AAV8T3V6_9ROSI|nr:hypothetical protein K2173_001556 [Erythroxylum novogranatense]